MGDAGYEDFLRSKSLSAVPVGFDPVAINSRLYPFQRDIVSWAVRRGRASLIEDCGLGKGPQQLEWASQVARNTESPVIGFAPLAVSQQFKSEAEKFGYAVTICESPDDIGPGINITNYEKLDRFLGCSFGGIFIDEASILKGFDGKFRAAITQFAQRIPYRLTASATPAPNDWMELGNQAEFLGIMSTSEMLATFFTHDGGDTSKWILKGHARSAFWEWVASWAVCIRKPSDLGYEDDSFDLPPLHMHEHVVDGDTEEGMLFATEAKSLTDRHKARKDSLSLRVEKCAELVNGSDQQWVVWCHLNAESDALDYAIPDAVQVMGADKPQFKEQAAMDFASGKIRVLISKPSIFGFGLNWQHCQNMAFVGLSDSYEQLYQAIRRCWRFGQAKPVNCHVICAETEGAVVRNIERKDRQSQEMFAEMVQYMKGISTRAVRGSMPDRDGYMPAKPLSLPSWVGGA